MSTMLPRRLLAWYGDDFTGSTDALEAMASNGVPAVLFLRKPEDDFFDQFKDYAAFGIAGSSRSETPEWMDQNLPPVFEWLRGLETPLCHYKVCSTFDSAPHVGNIGRAIEIGSRVFGVVSVPVIVGAPSLRRYVIFGNLFAAAGDGSTCRIDRHPVMSHHPVTPMHEADLGLHLAKQTKLPVRSLNLLELMSAEAGKRYRALAEPAGIVLFDTLDAASLTAAGRLLWEGSVSHSFTAGSSGVEYALVAWWQAAGLRPPAPHPPPAEDAGRLLVVSGSCSRVTESQISWAGQNGFVLLKLNPRSLAEGGDTSDAIRMATEALAEARSVVMYTAAGPQDTLETSAPDGGLAFRRQLGEQTGRVLREVLNRSGVERLVIAGGDTSSHSGRQLEIDALTFVAPVAPGAPLCRAWSRRKDRNGLEVVFKGGQCGAEDFFAVVKQARHRSSK